MGFDTIVMSNTKESDKALAPFAVFATVVVAVIVDAFLIVNGLLMIMSVITNSTPPTLENFFTFLLGVGLLGAAAVIAVAAKYVIGTFEAAEGTETE